MSSVSLTEASIYDLLVNEVTRVDLVLYRGDSGGFTVSVTNPQGIPVAVETNEWLCQVRESVDSPNVLCEFTVIPVIGDVSSVQVIIDAADSAAITGCSAVWDLQMTSSGVYTTTLLAGKVKVQGDVSRPA